MPKPLTLKQTEAHRSTLRSVLFVNKLQHKHMKACHTRGSRQEKIGVQVAKSCNGVLQCMHTLNNLQQNLLGVVAKRKENHFTCQAVPQDYAYLFPLGWDWPLFRRPARYQVYSYRLSIPFYQAAQILHLQLFYKCILMWSWGQ